MREWNQAAAANTVVTLIGNKSFDLDAKDNLTYHWKQIRGIPLVTLKEVTVLPLNLPLQMFQQIPLFFSLTANDGHMNNTNYVNVTVYKPQGFPLWLPVIPAAAGGGAAVWYYIPHRYLIMLQINIMAILIRPSPWGFVSVAWRKRTQ